MNIVLLGPPGSGKGTLVTKILRYSRRQRRSSEGEEAKIMPGRRIQMGEIFRDHIKRGTELGKLIKEPMERGELLPDSLVKRVIKLYVDRAGNKGVVFDGYPRSIDQAKVLQTMVDERGMIIDYVIEIDIPDDIILERLTGRMIEPQSGRTYHKIYNPPKIAGKDDLTGAPLVQRDDDKPATVKKRLKKYHELIKPLRKFYKKLELEDGVPKYITCDGERGSDAVFSQILKELKIIVED